MEARVIDNPKDLISLPISLSRVLSTIKNKSIRDEKDDPKKSKPFKKGFGKKEHISPGNSFKLFSKSSKM